MKERWVKEKEIIHPLIHSPNACNKKVRSSQNWKVNTQSRFPTWVAGTQVLNSSRAVSQCAEQQEAKLRFDAGTQIREAGVPSNNLTATQMLELLCSLKGGELPILEVSSCLFLHFITIKMQCSSMQRAWDDI